MQPHALKESFINSLRTNFDVIEDQRGSIGNGNVTSDRTYIVPVSGKRDKPWMKIDLKERYLQVSINVCKSDLIIGDALVLQIPNSRAGQFTRFTYTPDKPENTFDAFHFSFYPVDCIDFSFNEFIRFLEKCYTSYLKR